MHVRVLLDADGAGTAFEVRAPAGTVLPAHVRRAHDGVLVVLTGAVTVSDVDGIRRLDAGDTGILPRGVACSIAVVDAAHLLCVARPAGLAWLASTAGGDPDDLAALLANADVSLLPAGWRTL